jgi:hypothetical protein
MPIPQTQTPLAQITNPAAPPPLPPAPLWERLILENPWPTAGVLAILAIATMGIMSRTKADGDRRFAGLPLRTIIALALAILGGIVLAVGTAITTDREALRAGTARLVDVTARSDTAALERMLSEDVRLRLPAGLPGGGRNGASVPRETILTMVEQYLGPQGRYPLREHRIAEIQATLDGPRVARAQVRIRVVPEATALPYTSWWRIDWRKDGEGEAAVWRVIGIEPLVLPGANIR